MHQDLASPVKVYNVESCILFGAIAEW